MDPNNYYYNQQANHYYTDPQQQVDYSAYTQQAQDYYAQNQQPYDYYAQNQLSAGVNYNPEDYQASYEQQFVTQEDYDYDDGQDNTDDYTNELIDDAVEEIVMASGPAGKTNSNPPGKPIVSPSPIARPPGPNVNPSDRMIVKPSGKIGVNPKAGLSEDGNFFL